MKNQTQNWKKRKEKRKRMGMARRSVVGPFLAQRPFKPMPPLIHTGDRTETIHLQNGTIVTARCQLWSNEIYGVAVYEEQHGITQITIQREDCNPARDWRHLQQIKNEVVGEEREAVEIYPAESRKVDLTNTTHLWVMPEGEMVPFGMMPFPNGITSTMTFHYGVSSDLSPNDENPH